MPQINGIELLEKIGKLNKTFPVIMMTGHGGPELQEKAEKLGAIAFLQKSFRAAELLKIIDTHLNNTNDEQN